MDETGDTSLAAEENSEDETLKSLAQAQDDDDDYEPEDNRSKKSKKGKKRKARSEEKRGRKKKKRKKNDSGDESDVRQSDDGGAAADSDYERPKRSSRDKKKGKEEKKEEKKGGADYNMPSIEEVCSTFDLIDVKIEYTDEDYDNLVTYKNFHQHVRPILQKENPKVPMSKLMMLVAAKWREFTEENPNLQNEETEEREEEEPPPSPEYVPKSSRSRTKTEKRDDDMIYDDDDDDEEELERERSKKKSKSRSSSAKKGKKPKVPTLKIKFGRKKNASSDEDQDGSNGSERDSDAEFEKMLQQSEDKADKEKEKADAEAAAAAENGEPPIRKKAKTKIGKRTFNGFVYRSDAIRVIIFQATNLRRKAVPRRAVLKVKTVSLSIRTIARSVSREEKSSCATHAPRRTIWCVWIPSWKTLRKANGLARLARPKVLPTKMTTSIRSSVESARMAVRCFAVTVVHRLITRGV